MELLGMVLVLVLVLLGSEAQNQVNINVSLGQDVTLTCSINDGDIHWFMEVQNQFTIRIGQIFSLKTSSYDSLDFKTKYQMIRNQLVIQNFSAEDSRRYFCGEKKNDFSGGTFILIPAVLSTSPSVPVVAPTAPPCDCEAERLTFSIYRSAVVLSLLLSLTAALLCSCWRRRRFQMEKAPQQQEEHELMESMVDSSQQLREALRCIRASHPCIASVRRSFPAFNAGAQKSYLLQFYAERQPIRAANPVMIWS
ncbi:PREDICTED: uncharacterized protein LOC107102196 [Cyprinodon variegatus]|uniref:uncharacterized protein LOC107102196 n=1 Tax=Cyprinodon variegatus TaxID=28743 RepID=UPI00074282D6|nr:PREDICTED: uncharacterized protein LOC107102196 [Cyprinodon variegatus]